MPTTRPYDLLIGGVDRTTSTELKTIKIIDSATTHVSTVQFTVRHAGSFSIGPLSTIKIRKPADDTIRYFNGYILSFDEIRKGPLIDYRCRCVDFSWDLEHCEALYDAMGGSAVTGTDAALLQTALGTTNPSMDVTTHVGAVTGTLTDVEFDQATGRAALEQLAEIGGAQWYVDYSGSNGALHWFKSGSESNLVISDDPTNLPFTTDPATWGARTWGAPRWGEGADWSGIACEKMVRTQLAPESTKVLVIGTGVERTVTGATVGGRHLMAKLPDPRLTTNALADDRGEEYLRKKAEREHLVCFIREPGPRAGDRIRVISSITGATFDKQFLIQKTTTTFTGGGYALIKLELGSFIPSAHDLLAEIWRKETVGGKL